MVSTVLLIASGISALILSGYYILVFRKFNLEQTIKVQIEDPISVIICARNESENLIKYLPLVLSQDYQSYEVVVIDDASWDNTSEVLSNFEHQFSKLSVVRITQEQKRTLGKKMALTLGIKKAKYDTFLLTDADCWPKSNQWIKEMTCGHKDGFSLGYGAYKKTSGLLNLLVRFDTSMSALLYLSAAEFGVPYMGVGRNLAYSRSTYHDAGGFKRHYHIISGDDDLMVNHNAEARNTRTITHEDSHTVSEAPSKWGAWFKQKKRHLSVSSEYSNKSKIFLGIYHLSQLLFFASIVLSIGLGADWRYVLGIYLIKTLIQLLISIRPTRQLKENEMVALLPILEPVMLLINIIVGVATKVRRPKAWK